MIPAFNDTHRQHLEQLLAFMRRDTDALELSADQVTDLTKALGAALDELDRIRWRHLELSGETGKLVATLDSRPAQRLIEAFVCVECSWRPEPGGTLDETSAHCATHWPLPVTHPGEIHHRVMAMDGAHDFLLTNREARQWFAEIDRLRAEVMQLTAVALKHEAVVLLLEPENDLLRAELEKCRRPS